MSASLLGHLRREGMGLGANPSGCHEVLCGMELDPPHLTPTVLTPHPVYSSLLPTEQVHFTPPALNPLQLVALTPPLPPAHPHPSPPAHTPSPPGKNARCLGS